MAGEIEILGAEASSKRTMALVELRDLGEWASVALPSRTIWSCFLVDGRLECDADSATDCARRMLQQGAGFFYFWGPHARRLEEVFDLVIAKGMAPDAMETVPTVSSTESTLESAAEDFELTAWPVGLGADDSSLWLWLVVDDARIAGRIRRWARDRG